MHNFAHYTPHGHIHGGAWEWLFSLLLLATAITATVMAIKYVSGRRKNRHETAQGMLDKR